MKGIKSVKVPKSIDLDFKKKKIKVGRKVKKNNITKIKIQSKNINMPSQNIDKSIVDHDEQITLEKFKKHLSHHSPHVRQSALTSIKVILKSGSNNHIQSYIAIIFPPMMELLFDVEKSVRQTLLEVMSDLFHYFPLNSFTSIDSVVATYLCSGLTNLVKAIRKDSVRLLLSLLNSHTTYLSLQYTEVILAHLLNILSETVKSTSQDTSILNVNVTEASESTSKKAPDSFLLVLLQSIHLCTKSSVWYSGNKKTSDSNEAIDRDLHTQQQHSIGHFHNQARVRVHRISSLLSIRGADSATTGQPESDGHSIYSQVCLRLYSLWAYTLSAQSVLTQGVISVLTEVAYSLEELANLSSISGSADFTSFLDTLLRQFPYKTNTNATTSISHGSRKAEGLNLLICQLVFQALSSQDINAQQSNRSLSALREMNLFVVEDLTHFVQLVSRSDAPQQSIEEIETHDEEVETVVQARPSVPGRGGRGIGIRKTTTSTHSSNTKRLFECVHCVIRLGVQLKQPIESEIESILALLAQLVDRSKGASKVSALVIDTVAVTALEIIPFLEHCLSSADSNHAHDVAVGMIKVATSLIRIAPTLSDESSLQLLVSRIARMLRSVFSSLSMAGEGIDSFAALQLQALHDLFKLIFTNFQTISTEMQSQVVDLFYYCPLQGNLVAEAVKLGAFVCSSAVDVTVQTHFVRLLTER